MVNSKVKPLIDKIYLRLKVVANRFDQKCYLDQGLGIIEISVAFQKF